jgi:hypothetical protein
MQHKGQALEYALSLVNLLKQNLEVLHQQLLVEEIRDAEQGDLAETLAKLLRIVLRKQEQTKG